MVLPFFIVIIMVPFRLLKTMLIMNVLNISKLIIASFASTFIVVLYSFVIFLLLTKSQISLLWPIHLYVFKT